MESYIQAFRSGGNTHYELQYWPSPRLFLDFKPVRSIISSQVFVPWRKEIAEHRSSLLTTIGRGHLKRFKKDVREALAYKLPSDIQSLSDDPTNLALAVYYCTECNIRCFGHDHAAIHHHDDPHMQKVVFDSRASAHVRLLLQFATHSAASGTQPPPGSPLTLKGFISTVFDTDVLSLTVPILDEMDVYFGVWNDSTTKNEIYSWRNFVRSVVYLSFYM